MESAHSQQTVQSGEGEKVKIVEDVAKIREENKKLRYRIGILKQAIEESANSLKM